MKLVDILCRGSCMLSLMCIACSPQSGPHADAPAPSASAGSAGIPAAASAPHRSYSLTIVGYNYTDRYIDSFSVNGQGGGNVFISSPTSGGGGGVCCVNWWTGTKLPKLVRIAWAGSYCKLKVTNSDGETTVWTEPIFRRVDVPIEGPIPAEPGYFEVHFYKDGHVEVALTAQSSLPRLQLPGDDAFVRPGTSATDPPCPADYNRVREFDKALGSPGS